MISVDANRLENGKSIETKTDVAINEDTYNTPSGGVATVSVSAVTSTETSAPTTKKKNIESFDKSDMTLLFGAKDGKSSGLLGPFPANKDKTETPRIAPSQMDNDFPNSADIHREDGLNGKLLSSSDSKHRKQEWPHNHPPPGTSVAGSHLAKSKGKPSTIISISMVCPESQSNSRIGANGENQKVTSTTNSLSGDTAATTSDESSWLGVLSMGYLGTASGAVPEDRGTKYIDNFCGPSTTAWNRLASIRAMSIMEEDIIDLVITMAVNITCEIIKGKFNVPSSMPENQLGILLSLAVAEVFADTGSSFSVENDTVGWTRAIQQTLDLPPGFKSAETDDMLDRAGVLSPCPVVLRNNVGMQVNPASENISPTAKKTGSYTSLHSLSMYLRYQTVERIFIF